MLQQSHALVVRKTGDLVPSLVLGLHSVHPLQLAVAATQSKLCLHLIHFGIFLPPEDILKSGKIFTETVEIFLCIRIRNWNQGPMP